MRHFILFVLILLIFLFPVPAKADIAPPAQPPGSNPQPGNETTQVRMQAESVLIDVQATAPSKSLGQAHVTANFTMHNEGDQSESMAVRFPVSSSDGFFNFPEIKDFRANIDGKSVSTKNITGEDPLGFNDPVPWREFNVTFPSGQDVQIQVTYTLEAAGDYPFVWFKYVFSTGAGWKDSIGSADLTVRFPYPVSDQNVLFNTAHDNSLTTTGGQVAGNEINWHYADFNPTTADNFEIDLVAPAAWGDLLTKQAAVQQNPNDGEAWGQLGKAYKQLTVSPRGKGFRMNGDLDSVSQDLYRSSLQAYEKAVALKPNDPLWHAGLADLLAYYAYFARFSGVNTNDEALRSMLEIQQALALSPNDPKVQEIATEIADFFPDGMKQNGNTYDYPWLTATPLAPTPAQEIVVSTETPTPEATSAMGAQSTPPTSTANVPPQSSPASPVCGGALLIPIGIFILARRKTLL